ncbi:MAG: hypothetical protein JXJ04_06935 [Spirochaetales bacterium]|nr:hypothetical protein [Spirochaetales bacterium]
MTDSEKKQPDLLFIINAKAGSGYGKDYIDELIGMAEDLFHLHCTFSKAIAADHPGITGITKAFLEKNSNEKIIIAGGGGGTLSAVITAVCALKDTASTPLPHVRIGALRMGSGNVIAKKMGIPKDPKRGLKIIAEGIMQKKMSPVCIGRFNFVSHTGNPTIVYGATLMGFGDFGHIPGDVARFQKRHSVIHKVLVKVFGIEKTNTIEYLGLLFKRSLYRFVNPETIKEITVAQKGLFYTEKIISGVIMNFPIKQLPLGPAITMSDEQLYLHSIQCDRRIDSIVSVFQPRKLKSVSFHITPGESAEIRFPDSGGEELFIDEDPYLIKDTISISIAGTLNFITSGYCGQ